LAAGEYSGVRYAGGSQGLPSLQVLSWIQQYYREVVHQRTEKEGLPQPTRLSPDDLEACYAGKGGFYLLDGKTCQACAVKTKCSRAKKSGRQVLALPLYEFIQQQHQQEEGFEKRYRKRVGIEGTFSQAV
jgi:hypothetical protein